MSCPNCNSYNISTISINRYVCNKCDYEFTLNKINTTKGS